MAVVLFYEKPGCGTNARQKRMLEAAGHRVIAKDLLSEAWTGERLLGFFRDTAVADWFNPAAPRIKSGEIDPAAIAADAALALMLAEPLLIRRPLVEAAGQSCAGFEREPIPTLLGSPETSPEAQACSRHAPAEPCPAPGKQQGDPQS